MNLSINDHIAQHENNGNGKHSKRDLFNNVIRAVYNLYLLM